jgi:uracil-DNA glycosylase
MIDALDRLAAEIRACRICVAAPQGKPLPHEPRPVLVPSSIARILIAGQAPGARVHATGTPFTDPSGDRLRSWLAVTPEQFYNPDLFAIAPMGFCFPGLDAKGSDLPPRKECAPAWRSQLMTMMPQIKLVIAVGSYAHRWHLDVASTQSVQRTVEEWRIHAARTRPVFALPHPSWRNSGWLKRNTWFEAELLPALQEAVQTHLN